MTRLPRIPLIGRTADLFYTTLPYIGVRSWDAYAQFEVRNGELYTSKTGVGDIRMERLDSSKYRHEVFLGYEVQTWHESVDPVPSVPSRTTSCVSATAPFMSRQMR